MRLVDDAVRLCRILVSRSYPQWVLRALREWYGRNDPSACYHLLSKLDPEYYGWSVELESYEEFFKTCRGCDIIHLPEPDTISGADLFETIVSRRSRRRYSREPLSIKEISNVLFYAVGVTGRDWWGGPTRTYPSAGSRQPVEAYLISGDVSGVKPGVYHYNPGQHVLEALSYGDRRDELYKASLAQDHVRDAPATIVFTIVYSRTASKYGIRSYRYALLDTGFAGMNVYLVVEALGLATTAVGAFYDDMICDLLGVDCEWEYPLLLFPLGRRV